MRHFWPCLLVTLLLTARLTAQTPPTPAPGLYARAVKTLREGHFFESAIRDLTEASRRDPKNAAYHQALGDAEADRAGSLAYAAWMTDALLNARQQYPSDLAAWQEAQEDPKSDDFGKPAPPAPPDMKFQTKDDLRYLRLTGVQAVKRIGELGCAAQGEWAQAVTLSKTPADRAAQENAQGWGLLFLVRLLEQTQYPAKKMLGAPSREDAAKAFTAATKVDTARADYWQALGDAYPFEPYHNGDDTGKTIAAYQRALALGSPNPPLRFRLYEAQLVPHPKDALATLKLASLGFGDNGLVQDLLADALFRQVKYGDVLNKPEGTAADRAQGLVAGDNDAARQVAQDALAALERGIAANDYYVPVYVMSVPKTLRRAWDYWNPWDDLSAGMVFGQAARLRNLARQASGFAAVAAREGDTDNAARACNDCVALGMKLVGDWPVRDSSPQSGEIIQALVGLAIAAIGYRELKEVYTLSNQPLMAQQVDQRAEALRQRQKAYITAVTAVMSAPDPGEFLWGQY